MQNKYFKGGCNNEQFKIICDEILYWDGCLIDDRTEFSTTKKNTCDFIQFAFATQNKRVTIRVDERKEEEYITNNKIYTRKSNCYNLYISDKNKIGMGWSFNHTKIMNCDFLIYFLYQLFHFFS